MTYSDPSVAALLNDAFVPLQAEIMGAVELRRKYHAVWTPNLQVLDTRGDPIYRTDGWLPPGEFVPFLLVALGQFHFLRHRYLLAVAVLEDVGLRYPRSSYAPEALYYLGTSRYMVNRDRSTMEATWRELQRRYPDSPWAIRTWLS